MYVFEHFDDHSDKEINDKYKYQIQEDKKENLGSLILYVFVLERSLLWQKNRKRVRRKKYYFQQNMI